MGAARAVGTAAEATLAVATMPAAERLPVFWPQTIAAGHVGRTLLLAGRARASLRWLSAAVNQCGVLVYPVDSLRSALHLGQALEATQQPQKACAAYARILRLWGSARPRSVTADAARRRRAALGCEGLR